MSVWIMTERGWRPFAKACSNSNDLHGVYMPKSLNISQAENLERADRFNVANSIGNMMEKMHHFRGDHFPELIYGAFGEKL